MGNKTEDKLKHVCCSTLPIRLNRLKHRSHEGKKNLKIQITVSCDHLQPLLLHLHDDVQKVICTSKDHSYRGFRQYIRRQTVQIIGRRNY